MDLSININDKSLKIDNITFQKMSFIYNALQEGWSITKKKEQYIFSKKHEGKKEYLLDSYLSDFIKNNIDMNKVLMS
jgi:hypothetical protein